MKSAILITNTDMSSSAGNITLILRRAEAYYNVEQTFTHIVVYKGVKQKKLNISSEFYDISYTRNFRKLINLIKEIRPEYIILYGDKVQMLTYPLHAFINKRLLNSRILLDVQSSIEEKKEYADNLKQKLLYFLHYLTFVGAINDIDGAFVVSDELIENCEKKRFLKRKDIKYFKVRCGIDKLLSLESIQNNRAVIRKVYNIPEDAVVFVYSGYRMAWQKINETIQEMQGYDKLIENAFFMFFCNTDDEFETQLRKAFPKGNYIVKLLNKNEYQQHLCACDIGYLMRDYNETNRVAFPNKFSDYLSSGLLIAMNRALPEPYRILENNNLAVLDTDNEDLSSKIDIIHEYLNKRRLYVENALEVSKHELFYEEQVMNNRILV